MIFSEHLNITTYYNSSITFDKALAKHYNTNITECLLDIETGNRKQLVAIHIQNNVCTTYKADVEDYPIQITIQNMTTATVVVKQYDGHGDEGL